MRRFFYLVVMLLFGKINGVYSQTSRTTNTQSSDTLLRNYFFDALFGSNGSLADPATLVKIEIEGLSSFFVMSKQGFANYFIYKFKISDKEALAMEKEFLINNDRIPLNDTLILFDKMEIKKSDIYPDKILDQYRKMPLLTFLNRYCPLPYAEPNIFVIAYSYEKRLFFDISKKMIGVGSFYILKQFYKIQWDTKKKTWIGL